MAFRDLQRKLVSAPILAFPDFTKTFVLDTDASNVGIGAVLSQVEDGRETVIAYASRVLSKAERGYCVTRRELLAVVTFLQQFRAYLLGRHFVVRTDHGSLAWLTNFRNPEGQLARWLEQLQEFDFDIVHRPGRKHLNADALSRIPCRQCGRSTHVTEVEESTSTTAVVATIAESDLIPGLTLQELREAQLGDINIGEVLREKEKGLDSPVGAGQGRSRESRRLLMLWKQLKLKDGLLWRKCKEDSGNSFILQLVVPSQFRQQIIYELHSGTMGGHLGTEKTHSRVKERFYWPGYWGDVCLFCEACTSCTTRKTPAPKRRAPLQSVRAGYPMEIVAMDLTGPFPESPEGNRYILVVGDYFTKWMEVYALRDQEATTVAKKLVDEFFCRFSVPDQLHSDQGKQFESHLISSICELLQVKKSRTTPYHPQSDGLVERFNRTLTTMLATTAKEHPFEWESHLKKVCFAYNTSVHASTGHTPFFLMFGRQAQLPVDLVYKTNKTQKVISSEYAANLKQSLEQAYNKVRTTMGAKQLLQRQLYDRRVHGQPHQVGDLVWLHTTVLARGNTKKLHHPWKGPYRILKKPTDSTYKIQSLRNPRERAVVHFNRLKPCTTATAEQPSALDRISPSPGDDNTTKDTPQAAPIGTHLEIIEPMDPHAQEQQLPSPPSLVPNVPSHRYPTRSRQPPNRFGELIPI